MHEDANVVDAYIEDRIVLHPLWPSKLSINHAREFYFFVLFLFFYFVLLFCFVFVFILYFCVGWG